MVIEWRLDDVLKRRKVTALQLAKALGVASPTVYAMKRETRFSRITEPKLRAICMALKCQPGDLLRLVHDDGTPVHHSGKPAVPKARPRGRPKAAR